MWAVLEVLWGSECYFLGSVKNHAQKFLVAFHCGASAKFLSDSRLFFWLIRSRSNSTTILFDLLFLLFDRSNMSTEVANVSAPPATLSQGMRKNGKGSSLSRLIES